MSGSGVVATLGIEYRQRTKMLAGVRCIGGSGGLGLIDGSWKESQARPARRDALAGQTIKSGLEEAASLRGSCRFQRAASTLDVLDEPILAYDERRAIGHHLIVQNVVLLGNRAFHVTEDCKLEAQRLRKSPVGLWGIGAHSEHDRVGGRKRLDTSLVSVHLKSSTAGERLLEERQHYVPFALERRQRGLLPV